MDSISKISAFLESEGFGNAAKFLRGYKTTKEEVPQDRATIELLSDSSISQSTKIMVLADMVAPRQPEPNMNEGYPDNVKNNLQEIAWIRWKTKMELREFMYSIAVALDKCFESNNTKDVEP